MKRNKWIKVATVVISVIAIYLAFDIRRGISHYNRGANHMAEGEYDRAIACFDKAIKAESKFPEAHCNRGTAYYEKGQYDEDFRCEVIWTVVGVENPQARPYGCEWRLDSYVSSCQP